MGFDQARRELTQALVGLDARLAEQKVEWERTGYLRLCARSEAGWGKVFDVEREIKEHVENSIQALGAACLIRIDVDDDEDEILQTDRASLRAIRPQLTDEIAKDADRVLAGPTTDKEAAR